MLSGKILLCVVLIAAWHQAQSATVPLLRLARIGVGNVEDDVVDSPEIGIPPELVRARVGEGVPIPLCAGRCASPPAGPVCAFDATGTAKTFATLCELEAASCRDSIYYAITSLGEC